VSDVAGAPKPRRTARPRPDRWGVGTRDLPGALAIFAKGTATRGNWGHTGLAKLLKGITLAEATWKPTPQTFSIREEINHIAYWSEDVLWQLEGRGKPRAQAWPPAEGGAAGWRRDLARANRVHNALVRRLAALSPVALAGKSQKTPFSNAQLALGGVAHTAYHAGRIALLRRMYREAHASP